MEQDTAARAKSGMLDHCGFLWRFVLFALPFWSAGHKWMNRGRLALIAALTVAQVAVQVGLNSWSARLYNAIEGRHLDAFQLIHRADFHVTIHAGEAFGLPSIWEALQWCGAERLGHGVRIVDDITQDGDGRYVLGRLAAFVRDTRVPLEMCPTSNVHTGAVSSIAEHPVDLLRRLRFRVTVNTDNRLMSGVTLSSELELLARTFGFGLSELQWLTLNAMKSSFLSFDERLLLINGIIKPGYERLMAQEAAAAPTLV